jgi:ribonuclease-3
MSRELEDLEERIGYRFRDRGLLETALQHASYAHEQEHVVSNERLEFLGDAVVGLVVAHQLFETHPDWEEGDLTRALHNLIDQRSLARLGNELELGRALRLGQTEQRSEGGSKSSILSDAMEAVLGAMYLDGGLDPVVTLAHRAFAAAFEKDAPRVGRDPKTRLQEQVMSRFGEFPTYQAVRDSRIEGDPERFTVEVKVCGASWARGAGRSKRAAERAAAEAALPRLDASDD